MIDCSGWIIKRRHKRYNSLLSVLNWKLRGLYAEAKLGEIVKGSSKGTFKKGGETALPEGMNKKQSHHAQQLSKNNGNYTFHINQLP